MALEKELETYKLKLPELMAEEGKYVVIHETEVAGTFTSYEDAIKLGYEKYGVNAAFLVKHIQSTEEVHYISRLMVPCHTSPSR